MPWLKPWTDKQMDVTIAVILRTGVILSAVTVLVGRLFLPEASRLPPP